MKGINYTKAILSLFTLAIVLCGAAGAANAQVNAAQAQFRKALDFDGDGKADLTVTRLQNNSYLWYTRNSQTGGLKATQWGGGIGNNRDFECAGDFDGDGKADYCITRRVNEGITWYIMQSGGTFRTLSFGVQSDRPIPADYDGDGKADIAVWRADTTSGSGYDWYIQQSSNNQLVARRMNRGLSGTNTFCNLPPSIDIDGDGKQDLAQVCGTYGGNTLSWTIIRSTNGAVERYFWGLSATDTVQTDQLVPADYDGDGKTDIAVVRYTETGGGNYSYTWYIRRSSDGGTTAQQFGASNVSANYYDTGVPADYDGDGKADIAIYRNRTGGAAAGSPQYLYALQSGSGNSLLVVQWGINGDQALVIPNRQIFF